jgi:hypothetical protein
MTITLPNGGSEELSNETDISKQYLLRTGSLVVA